MRNPHKGDIGTVLILFVHDDQVAVDVSGASTKTIYIKKPSGTVLTKTASFTTDGTDGKIEWTTVSNDLDEAGEYQLQGYLVLASWTGKTDIATFVVDDVLA